MDRIRRRIIQIIETAGKGCSLIILVIMALVSFEVVSRYAFNAPTSWAWVVNKQLFGVFVLVAGSYALIHDCHIKIEMLWEHFPLKLKAVVRWISLACALIFLGGLLWKSGAMAHIAWLTREKATGVFKLPLYPLKLFMPVSAALFILGCLAKFGRGE